MFYFNFLLIIESWKMCQVKKIFTVSSIDNKSVYYYDFWRSCDTEDCSNDAENTAAHHRNKWYFTALLI